MSSAGIPLVMTVAGPQPTPPAALRAALLASVAATNPGYTANLPGSLIEDISSTDVGALVLIDSARIELLNSLDPLGANPFLLAQLGQMFGVPIGQSTRTSVLITFHAAGNIGFPIAQGFTVSDGTYQYTVQDNGVINSSGFSNPLFCTATIQGSWSVPIGTVNQIITSLPSTVTMTCTNNTAGTPGLAEGETEQSYRARVLQAFLAASQGMTRYMKTLLVNVPGVQPRLISVRQTNGSWEVLCGGGDPYDIANAIFESLFDINDLVGSTIGITGITNANPPVITTNINHGLTTGQTGVAIAGVLGMTEINGTGYTVNVDTEKTFSLNGVDSTGYGVYTSGGIVTPNSRNFVASINDYPDSYLIPFVIPPQQTVTMDVLWNTDSPNFVNPAAISQFAIPALVNYINTVPVGQPINVLEMNTVFQVAISQALDPNLLSRLVFTVSINGISTPVTGSTSLIDGDPESYFFATAAGMVVNQG